MWYTINKKAEVRNWAGQTRKEKPKKFVSYHQASNLEGDIRKYRLEVRSLTLQVTSLVVAYESRSKKLGGTDPQQGDKMYQDPQYQYLIGDWDKDAETVYNMIPHNRLFVYQNKKSDGGIWMHNAVTRLVQQGLVTRTEFVISGRKKLYKVKRNAF